MIEERLGHYRILEKIGAGGMGEVYRARDERLEREVAVKVLPHGMLSDDSVRKRLRKEAQILSKLNHPNIETLFDFDHEELVEFLVVEYVAGVTLSEVLSNGALPEKEVARIGVQLANGLAAAHGQKIVHRDLKADNLRLTSDGRLKILDFGIAKLFKEALSDTTTDSTTGQGKIIGTLPYMAPEQLRGERADARTDIYSAGVVLYEMATGKRPFRDETAPRLVDAILHMPPVTPRAVNARVSPEMQRIILKCLQKEPENRYQSAQELEVDLRQLATTGAAIPVPAPSFKQMWPWVAGPAALLILAVALTLVGLNIAGLRDRLLARSSAPKIESLAVLPLENLSGDPSQDYFADGMTEALITNLAQIKALRVISRTSMMTYKGVKKPLPQIARELRVDAVVEGTVQRSGDRVTINADLIQASTERHLWARSYEQDMRNILSLQSAVAREIADEVQIRLTQQERAHLADNRAVNPAAYDNYLKGRFYWNTRGPETARSLFYFRQAIEADPNYAPAYAGLADYYWASDDLRPEKAIPKAREYALKALKIDDTLAEAHTALALIKLYGEWDWLSAKQEFERALQLNPNQADARRMYSVYLSVLGNSTEALSEIKRAQELDPLSVSIQTTAGWTFYFARQYDRALDQCRTALALDANSAGIHDCLGAAYLAKGMFKEAIAESETATRISGNAPARLADLGRAYALAGKQAQAHYVLNELHALSSERYVSPTFPAVVYSALGERDQAILSLEKAYDERSVTLIWIKSEPAFDSLREDPRFQDLLRRLRLSA
jgi:eukaryotic-like serine/threonine-protein kinase